MNPLRKCSKQLYRKKAAYIYKGQQVFHCVACIFTETRCVSYFETGFMDVFERLLYCSHFLPYFFIFFFTAILSRMMDTVNEVYFQESEWGLEQGMSILGSRLSTDNPQDLKCFLHFRSHSFTLYCSFCALLFGQSLPCKLKLILVLMQRLFRGWTGLKLSLMLENIWEG